MSRHTVHEHPYKTRRRWKGVGLINLHFRHSNHHLPFTIPANTRRFINIRYRPDQNTPQVDEEEYFFLFCQIIPCSFLTPHPESPTEIRSSWRASNKYIRITNKCKCIFYSFDLGTNLSFDAIPTYV